MPSNPPEGLQVFVWKYLLVGDARPPNRLRQGRFLRPFLSAPISPGELQPGRAAGGLLSDVCRGFRRDSISKKHVFPTDKSEKEAKLNLLPPPTPVWLPDLQNDKMIHINYGFPAVFLLTFQRRALVEPVERCERARSLPTLSSEQESDSASIRRGLPARHSLQVEERRGGGAEERARHRTVITTAPLIIT